MTCTAIASGYARSAAPRTKLVSGVCSTPRSPVASPSRRTRSRIPRSRAATTSSGSCRTRGSRPSGLHLVEVDEVRERAERAARERRARAGRADDEDEPLLRAEASASPGDPQRAATVEPGRRRDGSRARHGTRLARVRRGELLDPPGAALEGGTWQPPGPGGGEQGVVDPRGRALRPDEEQQVDTGRAALIAVSSSPVPCVVASGSSASVIVAPRKPRPRSTPSTRGDQARAARRTLCRRRSRPSRAARRPPRSPAGRSRGPRASSAGPASIVTASSSVDTVARPRPGKCLRVGATPPSSRPAAKAVAPFAARAGTVEKARRCVAMNDRGRPGTSATGARSTSTPRRSSAVAVSRPRRRIAALGESPQLLGRGHRRRPAEAPHETSLLVGRDEKAPAT